MVEVGGKEERRRMVEEEISSPLLPFTPATDYGKLHYSWCKAEAEHIGEVGLIWRN